MQDKTVDEVINDIDNILEPVVGCPTIHYPHQRVKEDYEDQIMYKFVFLSETCNLQVMQTLFQDLNSQDLIHFQETLRVNKIRTFNKQLNIQALNGDEYSMIVTLTLSQSHDEEYDLDIVVRPFTGLRKRLRSVKSLRELAKTFARNFIPFVRE